MLHVRTELKPSRLVHVVKGRVPQLTVSAVEPMSLPTVSAVEPMFLPLFIPLSTVDVA